MPRSKELKFRWRRIDKSKIRTFFGTGCYALEVFSDSQNKYLEVPVVE